MDETFSIRNVVTSVIQEISFEIVTRFELVNRDSNLKLVINHRAFTYFGHIECINELAIHEIQSILHEVYWCDSIISDLVTLINNLKRQNVGCWIIWYVNELIKRITPNNKMVTYDILKNIIINNKSNHYELPIVINLTTHGLVYLNGLIYFEDVDNCEITNLTAVNNISMVNYNGHYVKTADSLAHINSEDMHYRDVNSLNHHSLIDDLYEAIYNRNPNYITNTIEDPELVHATDIAVNGIDMFNRYCIKNEHVVVCCWNSIKNTFFKNHVAKLNDDYSKGLIFTTNIHNIDPAFHVFYRQITPLSTHKAELGLIVCPNCYTYNQIGESGPHLGLTPPCVCGFNIATGDHLYDHRVIVIEEGLQWTSKRETQIKHISYTNLELLIAHTGLSKRDLLKCGLTELNHPDIHHTWSVIVLSLSERTKTYLRNVRMLLSVYGRSDTHFITQDLRIFRPHNPLRFAKLLGLSLCYCTHSLSIGSFGNQYMIGEHLWPARLHITSLLTRFGVVYGLDETTFNYYGNVCIVPTSSINTDWLRINNFIENLNLIHVATGCYNILHKDKVYIDEIIDIVNGNLNVINNSPTKSVIPFEKLGNCFKFLQQEKVINNIVDHTDYDNRIYRNPVRHSKVFEMINVNGIISKSNSPFSGLHYSDFSWHFRNPGCSATPYGINENCFKPIMTTAFRNQINLEYCDNKYQELVIWYENIVLQPESLIYICICNIDEELDDVIENLNDLFDMIIVITSNNRINEFCENNKIINLKSRNNVKLYCFQYLLSHGSEYSLQMFQFFHFMIPNNNKYHLVTDCVYKTSVTKQMELFMSCYDGLLYRDSMMISSEFGFDSRYLILYGKSSSLCDHLGSFLNMCSTFGFIYNYCVAFLLMTKKMVWFIDQTGNDTSIIYQNPTTATMCKEILKYDENSYQSTIVNRLHSVAEVLRGFKEKLTPKQKTSKIMDKISNKTEMTYKDYITFYKRYQYSANNKNILNIFVQGTRGDRTPLKAVHKHFLSIGVNSYLIHLLPIETSMEHLKLCEEMKGHKLITQFAKMKLNLMMESQPFLYPSYLGYVNSFGLGFGLHPLKNEIFYLKSGMTPIIDWLLSFVNIHETTIHICASDKYGTFPRSCDGENFLKNYNKSRYLKARKKFGVVMGSSSLPIPNEYKDWPIVPSGNHNEILKEYHTIACAGGCGIVHTAKMSGVQRVITWSDCIDRNWIDPLNAGNEVYGEKSKQTYNIIPFLFYPRNFFWSVVKYPKCYFDYFCFLVFEYYKILPLLWRFIFVIYNLSRFTYVKISPIKTMLGLVFHTDSAITNLLINKILISSIMRIKLTFGLTNWQICKHLFIMIMKSIHSAWFVLSIDFGFSIRFSLIAGMIIPILFTTLINSCNNLKFTFGKPTREESQNQLTEKSIWLEFKIITLRFWPVGFHVRLYDNKENVTYEGVHQETKTIHGNENVVVGQHFKLFKQTNQKVVNERKTHFAIKTNLEKEMIDVNKVNINGYYSNLWNCCTLLIYLLHNNLDKLGIIAFILLIINTSLAFSLLLIAQICIIFITSISFITLSLCIHMNFLPYKMLSFMELLVKSLIAIQPRFADTEDNDVSSEDIENIKSASVELLISAITEGFDPTTSFLAIRNSIVLLFNKEQRHNIVEKNINVIPEENKTMVRNFVNSMNNALIKMNVPISVIESLNWSIAFGINNVLTFTYLSLSFLTTCKNTLHSLGLENLADDIDTMILIALDPDHKNRLKATWSPKYKRSLFKAITFADFLYYTMPEQMINMDNNEDSIIKLNNILNLFKPDDEKILDDVKFQRKNFLPLKPRTTTYELEYDSLLHSVAYQVDPYLEARAKKWIELGGKSLIDGMWLTTNDEMNTAIIRRYTPISKEYSQEESELLEDVVSTIYNKHPELFNDPGLVTCEVVLEHLKKKYSSGIPFLNRYKKRNDLIQTGWMDSIIEATYYCLENGIFPPHHFHTFPKMQIVSKPRIIVAQDLLTTFISQLSQLEISKRSAFDVANFGMGAPMTSYHFGKIFSEVAKRKKFYSADATEFDSNCPSILFEGVSRLILKGCKGNLNHPCYKIQRAKMFSLQHGVIHDLMNSQTIIKNRGGSTGESNTSFDNHWMYRIALILALCKTTNQNASTVLENTTIHNTGDDNIFGCDLEFKQEDLVSSFKELFGLSIKIDSSTDITKLEYLHKKPVLKSNLTDHQLLNMVDAYEYLGVHIPEDIMSKRTAVLSRYSGLPDGPYSLSMIKRDIGHLNLCIHNKELYGAILEDYMNDVKLFINYGDYAFFKTYHDNEGFIIKCELTTQNWRRVPNNVLHKISIIRKNHRAPSYYELFDLENKIFMKPKRPFSKFSTVVTNPLLSTVVTHKLNTVRNFILDVTPDFAIKVLSNQDRAIYSPINYFTGWSVESFIYTSFYKEHNYYPNIDEMSLLIRQSMFPSQTDLNSFIDYVSIPGIKEKLSSDDIYYMNKGRMLISYVAYLNINILIEMLVKIPILNVLINLFTLVKQEIPRLYSHLNAIYWLHYGTSSSIVSSMIPKDPYIYQKHLALSIGILFPNWFCSMIGLMMPDSLMRIIVNSIAFIKTYKPFNIDNQENSLGLNKVNDWEIHANLITDCLSRNKTKPFIISAKTGTGKSIKLPALLLNNKIKNRVIILTPRRLLRDTYENPFTIEKPNKINKDVFDISGNLLIMTYGHFLSRMHYLNINDDDVIQLDEFHEQDPIMIQVYLALLKIKVNTIITSATIDIDLYKDIEVLQLDFPNITNYVEVSKSHLPFTQLIIEVVSIYGKDQKYLVICKSLSQMKEVSYILNDLGVLHNLIYSKDRTIKSHSLVATQIVDTGMNIPNLDIVIDCGYKVYHNKGRIEVSPTTKHDETQRIGRVGRFKSGKYFTTSVSGTSEIKVIYPNPIDYLINEELRNYYNHHYNLKFHLTKFKDGNTLFGGFVKISFDYNDEILRNTAIIWFVLLCNYNNHNEFFEIYSNIYNHGWTEDYEHISKYVSSVNRFLNILTPQRAAEYFGRKPKFQINEKGTKKKVKLLKWQNDYVIGI